MTMHALNPATAAVLAAWQAAPPVARYAVIADPMCQLRAEDLRAVPADATFADLLDDPSGPWLCQVSGEDMAGDGYLPRQWWHTQPRPGDVVVFHRRVLGGRNTGRSLLTLAVAVVAAYATGGASAWATAAYGSAAGAAAGAGAGIAVSLLGAALVNAVIPLDASNLSAGPNAQSPTYSAGVQGNSARLGQAIPVLYGHNLTYPDFACEPYQTFVDNQQIYHAVLCIGMGQYEVPRVSLDDSPIDHFADVEYLIIGPGQADGETLDDQTLVDTTNVNCLEVANNEMESLKVVGPFVIVPRQRQAIRLHVDVVLPRGLDAGRSISWAIQAREINDYEQPIGPWSTSTETYSTASAEPLRLSYSYSLNAARWQFRCYRTDIRDTSASAAHDMNLLGVRVELDEPGVDVSIPATYLVLKMRASQQLTGLSQRRIRVLSNRMLPVWDGTAWSAPVVTRNPAPAVADMLRNTVYGRGLADDQIDLAALLSLQNEWAARFDKFDHTFDSTTDTHSALALALRVGRAVPLVRGGRYTFTRDGEDLEPVAMYGMGKIKQGSFGLQLAVPQRDEVTALDVEYWDQIRWEWVTQTIQYVGASEDPPFVAYVGDTPPSPYTRAENRARIRLPGIIGAAHCAREGAYRLADMLFRRSQASYRTAIDGLLPAYGAPVLVSHDVPSWGQSGEVADWDGSTVTTTEPLDWSAGGTHTMRLQGRQGGVVDWVVTEGATEYEADVADAGGFTPIFDSANRERTRYVFGPAASMGALCRVKSITPRGARDIEHRVVLEDARVHTADEPWMPVGGVDPDPAISDGSSGGGTVEGSDVIVVRMLDRTVTGTTLSGIGDTSADITASWTLNDNGTAARAYVGSTGNSSASLANEWLQGGAVSTTITALYEVRATLLASEDPALGGAATLTGTLGAWEQLNAARAWQLTWVAPAEGAWAQRRLYIEVRLISGGSVQDVATVTLRCEYPGSGGGA